MTKVAKKTADLFCKLKLIYDFINPQFGGKPDLVEIESVCLLLFTSFSNTLLAAVGSRINEESYPIPKEK